MYSDIDSLTELSSSESDDNFDAKRGKAKSTGKEKKQWKLVQVLKAPRQTTHSVESIYCECVVRPTFRLWLF